MTLPYMRMPVRSSCTLKPTDIGTIDSWTSPESETTVGNLIKTRALSIRELLVSHRLLETGRILPANTVEKYVPLKSVCVRVYLPRLLEQR